MISLCVLSLMVLIFRWHLSQHAWIAGDRVILTFVVKEEPALKWDKRLQTEYWWIHEWIGGESVSMRLMRWPTIHQGDVLLLNGRLKTWNDENYSASSQNFVFFIPQTWLSTRWVLDVETVEIVSTKQNSFLAYFRDSLLDRFNKNLSSDGSGLLAGLIFGYQNGMSFELIEALRRLGMLHIAVASGFNAVLIANTFFHFASLLFSRKVSLIYSLIPLWCYVVILGFAAPIVRAALLVTLTNIGIYNGRVVRSEVVFFVVVCLMLLWKPVWLFDLSWQLSVAAASGLVWLNPLLRKFAQNFQPDKIGLKSIYRNLVNLPLVGELFTSTLAAQLAVFPLVLNVSHELSVISFVANCLLTIPIQVITVGGLLIGMLGFVLPMFADYLLVLGNTLLAIYVVWVRELSEWSLMITLPWNVYFSIIYYGLLMIFVYILRRLVSKQP